MRIEIDTSHPLSDADHRVLRALLPDAPPAPPVGSPANQEAVADTDTPEKPRRAPRAKKETAPEAEENEIDQELLNKAIARATELLKNKESALVKKALAAAGVERVSNLDSNEKIRKVLEVLS